MENSNYIQVRNSQIRYYRDIPLYYLIGERNFSLYKPPGLSIAEMRLTEERHPQLFIQQKDRVESIKELQREFNQHIAESITKGNSVEVKSTLCNLVEETLSEPRSGTLQALPETIEILVSGYSKQPEFIKTFASISFKDYSTVIHSVNVMALTIGFCFYSKLSLKDTQKFGLSALMHDVGKTKVPSEILKAQRKLTNEEFEIMKRHPTIGGDIIKQRNRLGDVVAKGALEHHEKIDGSGYPRGIKEISYIGQLIGIIDCYEALTNEDRPYRRAKQPLDTLKLLKEDVEAGKFDRNLFEKFCYSLI